MKDERERVILERCFTPLVSLTDATPFVKEFIIEDDKTRLYTEVRDQFVRVASSFVSN